MVEMMAASFECKVSKSFHFHRNILDSTSERWLGVRMRACGPGPGLGPHRRSQCCGCRPSQRRGCRHPSAPQCSSPVTWPACWLRRPRTAASAPVPTPPARAQGLSLAADLETSQRGSRARPPCCGSGGRGGGGGKGGVAKCAVAAPYVMRKRVSIYLAKVWG